MRAHARVVLHCKTSFIVVNIICLLALWTALSGERRNARAISELHMPYIIPTNTLDMVGMRAIRETDRE